MPSDPRITVQLLAQADLSVKADLAESWGRQWQEALNDTGFAKLTLANSDADLQLADYGDFLQFSLDGTIVFTAIVENKKAADISQDEEYGEATELSGRGWLAILEDAVVYRELGHVDALPTGDVRTFNYASIWQPFTTAAVPYNFGAWTSAGIYYTEKPNDFPNPFAEWIGAQAPVAGDNPVGYWYYFGTNFLPLANEGLYRLYLGADNGIDFWIDDFLVLSTGVTDFETSRTVDVYLTGGVLHSYAARVYNAPIGADNPSGFIASMAQIDPLDGSIISLFMQTDAGFSGAFITGIFPADPPQITPGVILITALFGDAQDRDNVLSTGSVLENLTWSFTDTADSNGVAWPTTSEITFQLGMDYLAALRQLAEHFELDFKMDPVTPTLHLYATAGTTTGVVFAEGVNLTELRHEGVG